MALFKCKSCGGDLEVFEGANIAECEYCGTKQPVPKALDENLQNLFNRANTLRIKGEFDKAGTLYERIIQADTTQADAYWGLILCKYGIEYVDDPKTLSKIPTCHRASYDSIIADEDYKSALEYADMSQRILYEKQAREIDRVQKDILALAQNEEKYDVFICYKETDFNGERTRDSVIANEIYYQLTQEGFKVFYAAITLEGKLGSAYEPIIFAALNSAKVMLVIGTNPEYYNAVWVKNEWSRFLKIVKRDHSKLLIPCFRDMDAYELPEEFAHLQSQDMSKIGFVNDLIRGIKKVVRKDEPQVSASKETFTSSTNANIAPLLKRAYIFLEDGEWSSADEYCEKVLDIDPECAEAYVGKLMIQLKVNKQDDLVRYARQLESNKNYQKAVRYANDKLRDVLAGYITQYRDYEKKRSIQRLVNVLAGYKNAAYVSSKLYMDPKMRHVVITGEVGARAFAKCHNIREVVISDGVTSIGDDAFLGCSNLQKITIPDSVTSIGARAFYECSSLRSIEISDHVRSIGEKAFFGCSMLTSINVGEHNWNYRSIDGNLYSKDGTELIRLAPGKWTFSIADTVLHIRAYACNGCANLQSITVPDSVKSIADSAFRHCSSLTEITLPFIGGSKEAWQGQSFAHIFGGSEWVPKSLKKVVITGGNQVDDAAFKECKDIETVVLPSSVISIGAEAFYGCKDLTRLDVPKSVMSIGDLAFAGCENLTEINIPERVSSIAENAFNSCTRLERINVEGYNAHYCSVDGNLYSADKLILIKYASGKQERTFTIPDYVISIGSAACGCSSHLTEIIIHDGVTSIAGDAFYWCENLRSITFPKSLVCYDYPYFSGCKSLQSITLPDGVTELCDNAFMWCTNLTSIHLPQSLTAIGENAFWECEKLESIAIGRGVTTIEKNMFYGCKKLKNVTLPDSITTIGDGAFWSCNSLVNITIPSGVTTIGNSAFWGCNSLVDITIPSGVTEIGDKAFEYCKGLIALTVAGTVTSIGANAFSNCEKLACVHYYGTREEWERCASGVTLARSVRLSFGEKRSDFDKVVNTQGSDNFALAQQLVNEALTLLNKGQPAMAEKNFDRVIKLLPDERIGYLGKAAAWLDRDYNEPLDNIFSSVLTAKGKIVSPAFADETKKVLEYPCGEYKGTLLLFACADKNLNVTQALLDMGANVNQRSIHKVTPLWYVCGLPLEEEKAVNGRKIARLLLNKGADVNVTNVGGIALYNDATDPEVERMLKAEYPNLKKGNPPADYVGKKKGGCYVATCVYGSYDCPQVWTLRRFRDDTLGATWYGRAFIHTYYAISPKLVKWFGETAWFKYMWQGTLDRMVRKLNSKGVADTPYQDKDWS